MFKFIIAFLFKDAKVADIMADFESKIEQLNKLSDVQADRFQSLSKEATEALDESVKANKIANKLEQLIK